MRNLLLFSFLLLYADLLPGQQKVNGHLLDRLTQAPVAYASVVSEKGNGVMSDTLGRFSFMIRRQNRLNDSVLITAIGYHPVRMHIRDLVKEEQVLMDREDKELENVRVFSSLKGDYRKFGYYRSWNEKHIGGEIGYIFDLPFRNFVLGAVQVKINHNYDTCWLRLHLRDVGSTGLGLPENELLKNEVIIATTQNFGLVEFDLDNIEIQLPTRKLYVGFELLKCGKSVSTAPSFFYMGNETGLNYFRESPLDDWKHGGDHTIYVRLLTKAE